MNPGHHVEISSWGGLQATHSPPWSSSLAMNGHWFSITVLPTFWYKTAGLQLVVTKCWFRGQLYHTQHLRRLLVTQISGPRFSHMQSDGPWEGPGKLVLNVDTNDMDVPLGLGTAKWALRRPPEE